MTTDLEVDDRLARLDSVLARLERLGLAAPPEVAPLAAGAIPPHVAAGELIQSSWGNAVVAEEERLRGEGWSPFSHGGGAGANYGWYTNGTTTLGPFTYPVQMIVMMVGSAGYGGSATTVAFDLAAAVGGTAAASSPETAAPAQYVVHTIPGIWNVPAGSPAGFTSRTNYVGSAGAPNTCYYSASGIYFIRRTGLT